MVVFLIGLTIFSVNGWEYIQARQSVKDIPREGKGKTEVISTLKTISNTNSEKNNSTLNRAYSIGEKVAALDIPELGKRFWVYWGTGEETLSQGVGMYVSKWTTVPNRQRGHTLLAGHRNTVFTGLGQLEKGDTLQVIFNGKTFEYEISKIWITDADDRTVIVKKEEPTLTLSTCYPFNYIGSAPERYIVQARLTGSYSTN